MTNEKISYNELKVKLSKAIGERVRELMFLNNQKYRDLVDKSGLSYSTIRAIVNGEIRSYKSNTIDKIAKALGVDMHEFFASYLFE